MTYRTVRWWVLWSPILAAFAWWPVSAAAQQRREAKLDVASAENSARKLRTAIDAALSQVGGDAERNHLHLVLGFSTGHFAQDPLSAQAARAVATSLVKDYLVPDDRLSVYAWEMEVWEHPQVTENPVAVGSGNDVLQSLWPLTPRTGSTGGHDTERTISQITGRLPSKTDAVIVLLTNTAASVSPRGQRVVGANDSDYRAALVNWHRQPQVHRSGASCVLPFRVIMPDRSVVDRSLDAVILVPKHFDGTPLRAARSDLLKESTSPQPDPDSKIDPRWILLIAVLTLLGVGLVVAALNSHIFARLFGQPALILSVEDHRFDMASVADGDEVCHLAGPGYPQITGQTVPVGGDHRTPSVRFARLIREGRAAIRIKSDRLKLQAVDGAYVDGEAVLRGEGSHRIALAGEIDSNPALPPQTVRIEVTVELRRADTA